MQARRRKIQAGGTRGTVYRAVAIERSGDAAVLVKQNRYAGAIYLAGYSVECVLKWAITQRRQCVYLPAQLETHDLDVLLLETGLADDLYHEGFVRNAFAALADSWGPELRYLAKAPERREADRLYREIFRVYDWILEQTI